jgi:hypothetical protein
MKDKIVLCGILVLIATLAVLTASAYEHDQTYNANATYFVEENIGLQYCNTTNVSIWANTSVPLTTGLVTFDYTFCCANATAFYPNSTNWENYCNGNLDTQGKVLITFATLTDGPSGDGTPVHIGDIEIHCCNESSDCVTGLIWNTDNSYLESSVESIEPVNWANGIFRCEAAPGIADHVVISEVQISGATATDEFVELYNPTNAPVPLEDWYLTKKTSGSTSEYHLLAGFPDTSIPAHGFFLITPQSGYTGSVTADATYSTTNSIAADNTVILYSDNKNTVVDKVGFGNAMDNETLSYPDNPGNTESLQRKINATIKEGGYGPAWDTGNNSADFFILTSNPRNSATSLPPIPELSTLMLLTTGLVALVGYVIVKKGRDE